MRRAHMAAVAAALASGILGPGGVALAATAIGPEIFTTPALASTAYHIRPLDRLNVTVFQVPSLSVEKVQVDATGQVSLPLVGTIQVSGHSTEEVAADIGRHLSENLQSPQVSVTVQEMAPHKVTVSGAVTEAGVFKFDEPATLSEAVAMAKGATHTANLHRVAIVRTVEGQRVAGVFDLAAIAAGRSADPAIRENDVIVVDDSRSKVFWREFVQVLPFLYVFTAL